MYYDIAKIKRKDGVYWEYHTSSVKEDVAIFASMNRRIKADHPEAQACIEKWEDDAVFWKCERVKYTVSGHSANGHKYTYEDVLYDDLEEVKKFFGDTVVVEVQ